MTDWLSIDDVVMALGLCEDCSRLLKECTARLRKVCREFERKIREVFRELSQCTCFRITPEKNFLRRTTQELTSLHLLRGRRLALFVVDSIFVEGKHSQTVFICLFCLEDKVYQVDADL